MQKCTGCATARLTAPRDAECALLSPGGAQKHFGLVRSSKRVLPKPKVAGHRERKEGPRTATCANQPSDKGSSITVASAWPAAASCRKHVLPCRTIARRHLASGCSAREPKGPRPRRSCRPAHGLHRHRRRRQLLDASGVERGQAHTFVAPSAAERCARRFLPPPDVWLVPRAAQELMKSAAACPPRRRWEQESQTTRA